MNVKDHNHTALHLHHHTNCYKLYSELLVKVEETSQFYHSVPVGHSVKNYKQNQTQTKQNSPLPKLIDVQHIHHPTR